MLGFLSAWNLALLAELAVVALVLGLGWRKPAWRVSLSRANVAWLLMAWCLVASLEYWALGPRSFVMVNDEGEFSLPLYLYQVRWWLGGSFAHSIAGGMDVNLLYGAQPFGLERQLFALLPAWIAVAVQKLLVLGVGASGAYVVARRMGGAGRWTALALAMMFTLAHRYSLTVTLTHGLGYALVPWAAWLLVGRLGRRFYWPGALGLAALHAVSCSPTHSMMALAGAPAVLWLVTGMRRPQAFLPALLLVIAATLANWLPVVHAMAAHGADSYRATHGFEKGTILDAIVVTLRRQPEMSLLAVLSLTLLAVAGDRRLGRAVAAVVLIVLGPVAALHFPWRVVGVVQLEAIDFTYIGVALTTVVLPMAGWASKCGGAVRLPGMAVVTLALALGALSWHKTWHAIQWAGMGGQSVYTAYENLIHRPWAPAHPFRVVSVPYRLEPNVVASYGLDTFDGLMNVVPKERGEFWMSALAHPSPGVVPGYTYVASHDSMDFLCCDSYSADQIGPLDALRLGNVEFVLSLLPLTGLEVVSGPDDGFVPPRRSDGMAVKLGKLRRMLFDPVSVYVYRVPGALPRAHPATRVVGDPAKPDATWYRGMIAQALDGAAVVDPQDVSRLPPPAPVAVAGTERTPDGYRVALDAPQGGILLVNQQFSRFWTAAVDGQLVQPVPANAIEMAVPLPPGARRVEMIFRSPSGRG